MGVRSADVTLAPRESVTKHLSLKRTFGWYDLKVNVEGDRSFAIHVAGHTENGKDSISDPALGSVVLKRED